MCNSNGCDHQTIFNSGSRDREVRKFRWERAGSSGDEVLCRPCHIALTEVRSAAILAKWADGIVVTRQD